MAAGLRPHTHEERLELARRLVPLWLTKFGDDLLAVAVSASVARGQDCAYSDLELDVFVRQKPADENEHYLQRIVDGMLIEAIYHTPDEFLEDRMSIAPHWHMSASDQLVPIYNAAFLEDLLAKVRSAQHPQQEFVRAATRERFELQESFSKVLNAIAQENREGMSLLIMDAALHTLRILALLNKHSFTTFSRYISEARTFVIKPERLDDLLDILEYGRYRDLVMLESVTWSVFDDMEKIFAGYGIQLYKDELDPNLPNSPYLTP